MVEVTQDASEEELDDATLLPKYTSSIESLNQNMHRKTPSDPHTQTHTFQYDTRNMLTERLEIDANQPCFEFLYIVDRCPLIRKANLAR